MLQNFVSLLSGFQVALAPENIGACLLGAVLGLVVGAMPGIGSLAGCALLLPLTYKFNPTTAIIMLGALYYSNMYGGSFSAILLNIPGDSPAITTALDGYPMAKKGRPGQALMAANLASFIGGTIGMFVAVIGGMWIINWGAKKGYTRQKMDSSYVEKKDITGILPAEQRKPAAMGISNPSVIDPMAFQMMIVGTIIAVSHFLREAIIKVFPFWERIPLYTMCLIMGAIIGVAISKTKYNQYIDRGSMKRISGVALEYAIAMNVATIKLSVLASYLVPILLTSAAITAVTAVICIVLAKKWYGKDWFEMAMGAYGQCTGSLATGLLLIKVLDPNGDTLAAESVSGSSTLGSFWQQPYNTIGPMMILASPVLVTLGTAGFLAAFLAAGTLLFGRTVKKS